MTATILHLSTSSIGNTAEAATVNLSKAAHASISLDQTFKVQQEVVSSLNETTLDIKNIEVDQVGDAPIERIYPHVFDEDATAGEVRNHILKALENAQCALDSYSVPDLDSMNTSITVIATIMRSAHLLTEFNESLGGVVSFLRRAALNTSIDKMTRPALNALVNTLQLIAANPMIDLDEACDLIEGLSNEGWCGEHGTADELVAMLFDELATENDTDLQGRLFTEIQTEDA